MSIIIDIIVIYVFQFFFTVKEFCNLPNKVFTVVHCYSHVSVKYLPPLFLVPENSLIL